MLPEGFIENQCQAYVQVGGSSCLAEALGELQKNNGGLDWTLLVRVSDRYAGAPFREILKWERRQSNREEVRTTPLNELNLPLKPIEVVKDTSDYENVLSLAKQNPYGLVVITWAGTDMVCGLASMDEIQDQTRPPVEGISTSEKPTADIPTISESQPGEKTTHEPGLSTTSEGVAAPSKATGMAAQLDFQVSRAREIYHKYRVNILVGFMSFLVFMLFPLLWTIRNEVLPELFPPLMTGEWNVAVARFDIHGEESISRKDASLMSDVFFNRFESEMSSLGTETGISIQLLEPEKTGLIAGETADERANNAAKLAQRLNADFIIYGTITRRGDLLTLVPEFYVDIHNMYEAEEMVGQHTLGGEISILGGGQDLPSQLNLDRELSRRSQVLALITKGLSLYFSHAYEDALEMFEMANDERFWEFNTGREVIYLFIGNAAGKARLFQEAEDSYLSAVSIHPEYARGYVGLGSIHYAYSLENASSQDFNLIHEHLDQAQSFYDRSLSAENQPESADIPAKVAFGNGQVYLVQWFAGQDTLLKSVESFQFVIDQYGDGENPRIQELASESNARLGLIAREVGELDTAIEQYTIAQQLATHPGRRGLYWFTLADLHQRRGNSQDAENDYRNAIEEYKAALYLTSINENRAEYWKELGSCYERLGELESAIDAYREAINLLPEGTSEREEVEERLAEITES